MTSTNLHHEDGGRASVAGVGDARVRPYGRRLAVATRIAAAAAAARPAAAVALLVVVAVAIDAIVAIVVSWTRRARSAISLVVLTLRGA